MVSVWVEMTAVKGNPDREEGDLRLGKVLWSPQSDKSGADIYAAMRGVQIDDIVLHLTNKNSISGISRVASTYDEDFICPPGTNWEGRPGYIVKLKDFINLESEGKELHRDDFFNEVNRDELLEILDHKERPIFYSKKLELNQGQYLTYAPSELVKLLNEIYKEVHGEELPYLDEIFRESKYWLFIVAKRLDDGGLWEYCKENSIAAMQYQYGSEDTRTVTTNLNQIKKIGHGDKVIVYLNKKIVGGIGSVTKTFYEDTSLDNGFDGIFGQRIGLEWLNDDFEKSIGPIWSQLSLSKKNLALKTIHEIPESDYRKISSLFLGEVDASATEEYEIVPEDPKIYLLNKKKQIILYGPPGTGKTYSTKNLAVFCILAKEE
jgi:hypothetical protein